MLNAGRVMTLKPSSASALRSAGAGKSMAWTVPARSSCLRAFSSLMILMIILSTLAFSPQ